MISFLSQKRPNFWQALIWTKSSSEDLDGEWGNQKKRPVSNKEKFEKVLFVNHSLKE